MGSYDDDDDFGLSAMMAKTSNRGRDRSDRGRRSSRSQSRSRSRSSSVFGRRAEAPRAMDDTSTTRRRRGRSMDGFRDYPAEKKDTRSTRRDTDRTRTRKGRQAKSLEPDLRVARKNRDGKSKSSSKSKTKKKTKSKKERRASSSSSSFTDGEKSKSSSKAKAKTKTKASTRSKTAKRAMNTADENDDTVSVADSSTTSSKASRKKADRKKKQSKEPISSQVAATRKGALSYSRASFKNTVDINYPSPVQEKKMLSIANDMDNLCPSPSQEKKENAATRFQGGSGEDSANNGEGEEPDELVPTAFNDSGSLFSASLFSSSLHSGSLHSTKSAATARSRRKETSGGFQIISNRAATEQAEAVLNRLAARHKTDSDGHFTSLPSLGNSFGSGMDLSWRSDIRPEHRSGGRFTKRHSLTSGEDDASNKSVDSHSIRSRGSMPMNVRQRALDEYRKETENLRKQLSDATAEVEELKANLEETKNKSKETVDEFSGLKTKLEFRQEEKAFLIESVRDLENDFVMKTERVEKLQQLIDEHLATVEYLESKLDEAEEEILTMDDELCAVFDWIEDKDKMDGEIKSSRLSKKERRSARLGSIQKEFNNMKGAIHMQKIESKRFLSGEDDSLGDQLKSQESKLRADQERCDSREKELDARERKLLELENRLKEESARKQNEEKNSNENDSNSRMIPNEESDLMKLAFSDRFVKTTTEGSELDVDQDKTLTTTISTEERRLSDALVIVDKKNETIKNLEEEIEKVRENFESNQADLLRARALLDVKNEVIKSLEEEIEKSGEKFKNVNNTDQSNGRDPSDAGSPAAKKDEAIKSLEEEIDKLCKEGEVNQTALVDKNNIIKSLEEKVAKLQEECQSGNASDLSNAIDLVGEKTEVIKNLEEEVEALKMKYQNLVDEEEGKDILILELQTQLVNTKKQVEKLSSNSYVTKLKCEIKALKENIRGLKMTMKEKESIAKSNLKKKDASVRLVEKKMEKLTFELEKREKRDKHLGTGEKIGQSNFEDLIEELEEDIVLWKSANAELINEIEYLKANGNFEMSYSYHSSYNSADGDFSTGSSRGSRLGFNSSQHSVSSTQDAKSTRTSKTTTKRRLSSFWAR